jgi:hypothetical protein
VGRIFKALSFDDKLPCRFRGEVLSVFSGAFNIRTEKDDIISIVAPEKWNGPNRILLKLPAAEDFLSLGLRVAMPVVSTRKAIDIDSGCFLISLPTDRGWSAEIKIEKKISSWQVQDNFLSFRKFLVQEDGGRVAQEFRARSQSLIEALEKRDFIGIPRNIKRLVGFGKGLTPSGDDFLLGLIASLYLINDPRLDYLVSKIKEIIASEREKTTFLSAKFLEYASQGRFSESILNLLEAILTKNPAATEEAVKKCLDFGASSGRDTLFGIASGLSLGLSIVGGHKNVC